MYEISRDFNGICEVTLELHIFKKTSRSIAEHSVDHTFDKTLLIKN